MTGTYNHYLVIISALIAVFASYTGLALAGRVATSQNIERKMWLVGGGIAMGTGIWSMHFLAMLAFSLPIDVHYNFLIVVVSLLAAILASGQALFIVTRPSVAVSALLASATFIGVGIGVMHYTGMAAMEMTATISYKPALFLLSVAIAVVVSLVALKLFLQFRSLGRNKSQHLRMISAIVMGAAILLLHYTGMAAAMFKLDYDKYVASSALDNNSIAFLVASFTFLILSTTLIIATDNVGEQDF